jgi:hypothetical protein
MLKPIHVYSHLTRKRSRLETDKHQDRKEYNKSHFTPAFHQFVAPQFLCITCLFDMGPVSL